MPFGREDVRSADEIVEAKAELLAVRPKAAGVVVQHDDSCAGFEATRKAVDRKVNDRSYW